MAWIRAEAGHEIIDKRTNPMVAATRLPAPWDSIALALFLAMFCSIIYYQVLSYRRGRGRLRDWAERRGWTVLQVEPAGWVGRYRMRALYGPTQVAWITIRDADGVEHKGLVRYGIEYLHGDAVDSPIEIVWAGEKIPTRGDDPGPSTVWDRDLDT